MPQSLSYKSTTTASPSHYAHQESKQQHQHVWKDDDDDTKDATQKFYGKQETLLCLWSTDKTERVDLFHCRVNRIIDFPIKIYFDFANTQNRHLCMLDEQL